LIEGNAFYKKETHDYFFLDEKIEVKPTIRLATLIENAHSC